MSAASDLLTIDKRLSVSHVALLAALPLGAFTLLFAIWTATSLWSFPRFVVCAVVLVYLPGKLLLDSARVRVSPLEDLTLSLILGITASTLLYWIASFSGYSAVFVLWPLVAAGLWIYRRRKRWREMRHSCVRVDASHVLLLAVLVIQLAPLSLLPLYYQNVALVPQDGLAFLDKPQDAIFHLSIANELKHSIPPQVPYLSGQPLGYHYGMDLLTAMLSNVGGLSVLDLTARFTPTLLLIMSTLSVFSFSRAWLGSGYGAALSAFLVVLGEDLSFVPGLLLGSEEVWSVQFFGAPSAYSLYFMNPMLPALGILFGGLFCLARFFRDEGRAWLVFAGALFAISIEYKIFVTAHVLLALALTAFLYLLLFRDRRPAEVLAVTGLMVMPLALYGLLGTEAGTRVAAAFRPWPYIPQAVQQLGLSQTWIGRQVGVLYAGGSLGFGGVLVLCLVALPGYLVGSLGTRVLALPGTLKGVLAPSASSSIRFLLGLMVIAGPAVALIFTITPLGYPVEREYNEAIWFYVLSKYVASVLAVEFILHLCRGRRAYWQGLLIAGILALSVPSTAQFMHAQMAYELDVVGESELELTRFLDIGCSDGQVVLSRQQVAALAAAVTRCRVPVLNIGAYTHSFVSPSGLDERKADRDAFWDDWSRGELRTDILERYQVDYVVVDLRAGDSIVGGESSPASDGMGASVRPLLTPVFSNEDFVVYGLSGDDEPLS